MATDFYLLVEGINGETKAEGLANHIELLSWSSGVSNTTSVTSGTGSGAGRASFSDLTVTKVMDKASVPLLIASATGKHIPKVTLKARKAGGKQEVYYDVVMSDVILTSVQVSGSTGGDDLPIETVSISFAKIEYTYKPQAATGGTEGPIKGGYDLKLLKKI